MAAAVRWHAEATSASHLFFLGDNVYEEGQAGLIGLRYLDVYGDVFALGVAPHAALGNHDVERCRDSGVRPVPRGASAYAAGSDCWVEDHLATPEFGYPDGSRYYSVAIPGTSGGGDAARMPAPLVEVFVLDSNTLGRDQNRVEYGADAPQRDWLAVALSRSAARWKVVALHHPLHAPERCHWLRFGCRGDDGFLRAELEPIFREHGVDVVFQAHQHLYARLKPQHGIHYFVTGAGGKRADSFRSDPRVVPREDRGSFNHFMSAWATRNRFGFEVFDTDGKVRDQGSFPHRLSDGTGRGGTPCPCPAVAALASAPRIAP